MDSGIYALIGVVVGGVVGLLGALINNHYANKRHVREICFKSGLEEWKKDIETAIELKKTCAIFPLEDYVLRTMLVTELVVEKRPTSPKKLEKTIRRIDKIMLHVRRVRIELDNAARSRGGEL